MIFWRDQGHVGRVVVRPDGKISLPLLNESRRAGLTPEQLRAAIVKAATKFVTEEPTVAVIVKADQQPQGLHQWPGRQAGPVSADARA